MTHHNYQALLMDCCPLCHHSVLSLFHSDSHRDYYQCQQCQLVFVPQAQHLDRAAEQAIYDLHQNQLDDPGYHRFLSRLALPLLTHLAPSSQGLDYGCGPAPLLARILENAGHHMQVFDPLYANQTAALQQSYDFISCSEVAEHFRQPGAEFARLFGLLKPDGTLAIMTKRVLDQHAFQGWHYKNDMTHISFYSATSLQWLATHYHRQLSLPAADVAIFHS